MDLLHLTLTSLPFTLMEKERKRLEFRTESAWIASRLAGKHYTHVKFTNGYGADKPWFIAEYIGYARAKNMFRVAYPGGLVVWVLPGDYIIFLGRVIDRGNIKPISI